MRIMEHLQQGAVVTVIAFGGKQVRRRVWEDMGNGGVLIC
jgi:hypothetical protein